MRDDAITEKVMRTIDFQIIHLHRRRRMRDARNPHELHITLKKSPIPSAWHLRLVLVHEGQKLLLFPEEP